MKLKKSVSQHTVEAYAICACSYVLRCPCGCNCSCDLVIHPSASYNGNRSSALNYSKGDTANGTV